MSPKPGSPAGRLTMKLIAMLLLIAVVGSGRDSRLDILYTFPCLLCEL